MPSSGPCLARLPLGSWLKGLVMVCRRAQCLGEPVTLLLTAAMLGIFSQGDPPPQLGATCVLDGAVASQRGAADYPGCDALRHLNRQHISTVFLLLFFVFFSNCTLYSTNSITRLQRKKEGASLVCSPSCITRRSCHEGAAMLHGGHKAHHRQLQRVRRCFTRADPARQHMDETMKAHTNNIT